MANRHSIQRQQAYERLRPMLLHGQLLGGTRLGEVEWAGRLGVHRGALREAFVLLMHEGLLIAGERGGHFVPMLDAKGLDEILELRAALEISAIRRLGQRGKSVDICELRKICLTMRHTATAGMPLGFAEADRRFHERIIEMAGNHRMTRAYMQAPLLMALRLDLGEDWSRQAMANTIAEHEQLCDLLEDQRFEDAASHLEQHLFSAHSTHRNPPLLVGR